MDLTPDVVELFGGYALAIVIGYVIAALLFGRAWSGATHADELPRLPVFLRFDHRRVVVIGGGNIAASKIPALLAAGGNVTVVSPSVSRAIDRSRVTVIEREFHPADLDGAWFVTAAATPEV